MMQLLEEAKEFGINDLQSLPSIHCKAFKDNEGAYKIARLPKMRACTKHMNIKFHHFLLFVENGLIKIISVNITKQLGNMFTKPLWMKLFKTFRQLIMGW